MGAGSCLSRLEAVPLTVFHLGGSLHNTRFFSPPVSFLYFDPYLIFGTSMPIPYDTSYIHCFIRSDKYIMLLLYKLLNVRILSDDG